MRNTWSRAKRLGDPGHGRAKRRRRAIVLILLASALAVLLAPFAGAASATGTEGGETSGAADEAPAHEIIPDVVISIAAGPAAADDAAALIRDLNRSPSIAWAADDRLSPDAPSIVVAFADDAGPAGPRAVTAAVAASAGVDNVTIAGRDVSDRELLARVGLGVFIGIALAAIAFGVLVSWLTSFFHGVVAGLTVGSAAWLGGMVGSAIAGRFDGSLVTTPIPAVLSAIVLAVYVSLRLLVWFADPEGEDQADMIRRSAIDVAPELLIFMATFTVVAAFSELVAIARPPATVALAGAMVGALLPLAVLPGLLAALHQSTWLAGLRATLLSQAQRVRTASSAESSTSVDSESGEEALPESEVVLLSASVPASEATGMPEVGLQGSDKESGSSVAALDDVLRRIRIPNGRDYPVIALVGLALFLALLGLSAIRSTGSGVLLDERSLGADSAAVIGTRDLLTSGGDPTAGVLARFPDGTSQGDKQAWLEQASGLRSVARVDSPIGRHVDGVFSEIEALVGPTGVVDDEAPTYALVVPAVTGRSGGALDLVEELRASAGTIDVDLAGGPIDASDADQRDRSQVWLAILGFAIVGAIATWALVGDRTLALLSFGLRALSLAAVAGIYRLLVNEVSGAELQLAVVIVAAATFLFDIGFLKRVLASRNAEDADQRIDRALDLEGAGVAVALGLAALAALGMLVPDLTMLRRFAILLAVVVLVETILGMWLLRPAVLGSRALAHFASGPVDNAISVLAGKGVTSGAEHEAWVDVVAGLLWTEFTFQSDPPSAVIDSVYASGTFLYQSSADHHQSLAEAGLRIVGRHPQLRSLRVINNSSPATVAVTVDHPVRQLTDAGGKIVGVRKAERRSVMLWLAMQSDGSYRITDSVELGTSSLGVLADPVQAPSVVSAPAR